MDHYIFMEVFPFLYLNSCLKYCLYALTTGMVSSFYRKYGLYRTKVSPIYPTRIWIIYPTKYLNANITKILYLKQLTYLDNPVYPNFQINYLSRDCSASSENNSDGLRFLSTINLLCIQSYIIPRRKLASLKFCTFKPTSFVRVIKDIILK